MMRRRASQSVIAGAVIMTVLLVLPAKAFDVPAYDGYVTDEADVLSTQAEQSLAAMAEDLERKTQSQLAILTVDSLQGDSVEQAALQTAREWGVGHKNNNKGLLILVAVSDRKLRTEIGYGLEGIITDGTSGEIQDTYMVPYFRAGDYEQGIVQGSVAYASRIAEAHGTTLENAPTLHPRRRSGRPEEGIPWPPLVILFLVLLISSFNRPRRRRGIFDRPFIGGYYGGSFGGGSFSGGGSSFGGFGGGGFGGGGSSRSW